MSKLVFRIVLGVALVSGLVVQPSGYGFAQTAAKDSAKESTKSEAKAKKPLTAQQLKMKECGAKWQEEKKAKGVKGREAWNKFRSACLKS